MLTKDFSEKSCLKRGNGPRQGSFTEHENAKHIKLSDNINLSSIIN